MRALKIAGWVLLGVAGVAGIGLALGVAVMLLWNWLMPPLFGLPDLGYWQAVGLFVLCHLLFGGGRSVRAHRRNDRSEERRPPFASCVRRLIRGRGDGAAGEAGPQDTAPGEA